MAKRIVEPGESFVETDVGAVNSSDLDIVKKIEVVPIPDSTGYPTPKFIIGNAAMSLVVHLGGYVDLYNRSDQVQTVSGVIKNTGSGEQISFRRQSIKPQSYFRNRIDVSKNSVTKLEITLTLHTKENASNDGWIR